MIDFRKIKLFIGLIRLKEPLSIILVSTALAYVAGNGFISRFTALTILSIGAVTAFGFMINHLFDAKYDGKGRNPISAGAISYMTGVHASCFFLSLFFLSLLPLFSNLAVVLLLCAVLLGLVIYSSPPFRLKEKYPYDVVIHSTLTASPVAIIWISAKGSVDYAGLGLIALGLIIGFVRELEQELRDFEVDRMAGFRTTVFSLGIVTSYKLTIMLDALGFLLSGYLVYSGTFGTALIGIPASFLLGLVLRFKKSRKDMDFFLTRATYAKAVVVAVPYLLLK